MGVSPFTRFDVADVSGRRLSKASLQPVECQLAFNRNSRQIGDLLYDVLITPARNEQGVLLRLRPLLLRWSAETDARNLHDLLAKRFLIII